VYRDCVPVTIHCTLPPDKHRLHCPRRWFSLRQHLLEPFPRTSTGLRRHCDCILSVLVSLCLFYPALDPSLRSALLRKQATRHNITTRRTINLVSLQHLPSSRPTTDPNCFYQPSRSASVLDVSSWSALPPRSNTRSTTTTGSCTISSLYQRNIDLRIASLSPPRPSLRSLGHLSSIINTLFSSLIVDSA
jgi:hypothetical protein